MGEGKPNAIECKAQLSPKVQEAICSLYSEYTNKLKLLLSIFKFVANRWYPMVSVITTADKEFIGTRLDNVTVMPNPVGTHTYRCPTRRPQEVHRRRQPHQ